ncbi:hypothetical protein FY034_06085 [Trichlorobacter lovleyi]|uniref:hypothetical protein n=1 Tax=Trichlorobacter lovleyi TaxID=313985 RepID=UPI00223EFEBF|nr:hypothetical protein [Trichlorobacter lovleyi]QOX78515.1 hypothetical protein FY034_06085 [Trichlorobacter lovleyi]
MNRQKQLLIALLVIFMLSLAYAWLRTPRQQVAAPRPAGSNLPARRPAPGPAPGPAQTAAPAQAPPGAAAPAATAYQPLALPEQEQAGIRIKRDLFIPLQVVEAKIAAKKAAAIKPPPPPPPPPPPTPQELARKELAQYKSLGLLKKQGKQVAFLAKGGQIKLVRVGDSLINGYKVTAITDDRLVLHADDGDEMSLGMR